VDFQDSDTLAILENKVGTIRFITADEHALGSEDFKVLLWDKKNMVIGLADSYVSDFIDLMVVDQVIEDLERLDIESEDIQRTIVNSIAQQKLAHMLETIMDILKLESDPSESSIDDVIENILNND
tara:strand:- start:1449 stop:1826 length:378 start_codon:yes stop_codon:yes gene_type:complete